MTRGQSECNDRTAVFGADKLDAKILDEEVRSDPEHAYEPEFWQALLTKGVFNQMP